MNLIVESQYFPPVTLLKMSIEVLNIKFDAYEPWRKMSFRNRCVVVGSNGPINLSIPVVEGREQKKLLKEVRIDNGKPWQSQHWKTITSCYNRSPWFDFFEPELSSLYSQPVELLHDWNRKCFEWAIGKLGLPIQVEHMQENNNGKPEPGWIDCRNKLTPKTLQTDFPDPVRYHQVFEDRIGFIPHLSVLDLLFCEGKNARRILSAGA
jgi:hypothetical protein